ncbi:isopentenyldiphosphate isomerase [Clostridium acetobutylicum]|uniref:Uncharacterized Nudix hydrolase CA_C0446 n=1 Tax=Clostridium acetobutylicum (strain ATCC 824 / DSM 792 / JCM 1419 / IAM 19013 / LMG 5710 / NBRC 13948 / NRRL B-527 / VKM B-1787 / 2291 / W) TaxID=272562 RepID=Y446_CLOAB|nr:MULTISPECIES: NUDIX domain-containing protein [Clostridium]Q97LV8.1 RecName: Full=Uncharacterized Nudix hydrolase CA_C0446 [Clostridium acetobutylicum ATCC 824]AAK78426.1 Hydrolase of MutT (Nudix) family [Clostridium acetobutylicum ATCC 824]ADZ19496.1 Hydrolase of MutT (Nudix) family [Clostridium acetobutylicum EA 2018]AEI31247.1 MutT/NUDIX family hydrolase [Clostridium acetobutylicum DSM 1731]AWV80148.1 NUDIX domain-containing protein [Clostridium acetobutylicum]MBC2392329.1 NUDIX domain-
MEEEFLDIFDEEERLIGRKSRKEVHEKGYWHSTFHCWVVKREGKKTFLIFQKRHPLKDTAPNMFDVSSAGHIKSGESIEDGVRELKEELGIDAKPNELINIGIIKEEFHIGKNIDREFCHIYIYSNKAEIESYTLQRDEVVGLVKIEIDELARFLDNKIDGVFAEGFIVNQEGRRYKLSKILNKDDFVPHKYGYYKIVLRALMDDY